MKKLITLILNYTANLRKLIFVYLIMSFANRVGEFGILYFLWFSIDSPKIIGILLLLDTIVGIYSGLLYSSLSRIFTKTTIVKITYIIRILTYFLFLLFFFSSSTNYWILGSIIVIHSLSDSFLSPIVYSSITQVSKKESLTGVNSIVSLIDNFSLFLSPVIGSLLIGIDNGKNVLLFILVICVLTIGLISIFRWKEILPVTTHKSSNNSFIKNIIIIFKNKTVFFLMLCFLVFNFVVIPLLNIIYPAFLIHENNLSSYYLALYEIAFSLGLILLSISQIFTNTSANRSKFFIILSFLTTSLGLFIIVFSPSIYIGALGSLIIGCSLSLLRIHNTTFFQSTIPLNKQSDFFVARGVILNSVSPFSVAAISFLIAIYYVEYVMIAISIVLLTLGLTLICLKRQLEID